MAQTGYTPISLYYSSTASNAPTAGNLVAGELAINTADGKLFYKDSAGVVQVIGTKGGVGSSTTTQVLYNSSGLVVGSANMTFNGTTLTLANDASISGLTVGKGLAGGSSNTALGYTALSATTSGVENTGVGSGALQSVTTGSSNTAVGRLPLLVNTTGGYNTAIGTEALRANTTASNNTAVGYQAGYSQTTANNEGQNTFVGRQSGYNTTGSVNTFIGANSGVSVTTGNRNTILGQYTGNQGGLDIRTASNYIVLSDGDGNPRGYFTNTGVFRVVCSETDNDGLKVTNSTATRPYGIDVAFSGSTPNNTTQYFYSGEDATNQKVAIYSSGTVTNRTGTYNAFSDIKLKQDVIDANSQWDDIKAIRFRKYRLIDDVNANADAPYLMGVVAQELQQTSPNLVEKCFDKEGEVTLGVKQSIIFMKAAKALQEAMERIETLEAKITALENK